MSWGNPPKCSLHPNFSLLPRRLDRLDDLIHHTRITQRARVAQTVLLAAQDLPQDAAHDLAGSRLGQIRHHEDGFGGGEGPDTLPDLQDQVLLGLVAASGRVLERDEGVNGLAGEFVVDADHGGFGDEGGLDKRRFDLGGGEAVAGHVDDVVDAAADPVIAFVVAGGAVTGKLGGGELC